MDVLVNNHALDGPTEVRSRLHAAGSSHAGFGRRRKTTTTTTVEAPSGASVAAVPAFTGSRSSVAGGDEDERGRRDQRSATCHR